MTVNEYGVSLRGDKNVLKLTIVVMVAQLHGYIEIHRIVHSKWINDMVCELYLNTVQKMARKQSGMTPERRGWSRRNKLKVTGPQMGMGEI